MEQSIHLKGVRVNNLKDIDLDIPLGKFVVITGVSGSGKSSLAFDTLYAEGQRRYVESLSAYARQFMGRMNKPDCTYIKNLPPAIAIEQKQGSRNPRSTVGTSTEIYDYLRMLFARVGRTFSPVSGKEVRKHTVEDVVRSMLSRPGGTRFTLLAPLSLRGRSLEEYLGVCLKQGLSRLDIDGRTVHIDDILSAPERLSEAETANGECRAFLLIDRLVTDSSPDVLNRFRDSVETAFFEGDGRCLLRFFPSLELEDFSERFEADGITFEEPSDQFFSFNSPVGACPECEGFGRIIGIDERLVVPDTSLSVVDGAVMCWRGEKMSLWKQEFIRRQSPKGFPIFKPYFELTQAEKDVLWHGDADEQARPQHERVSIDAFFEFLRENQYKIQYRVMLARYRGKTTCPICHGGRLRPETSYVKVGGRSLPELVRLPADELRRFFDELQLTDDELKVASRLLAEIRSRLAFLSEVGLGYLTLDRPSNTLSGGESQRINLATSLGSSLVGSLYILDEPSIGLHSRDTARLISVLRQLRDLGNTVVVVEHDEEIMRAADYIIDIGPDAGRLGGQVMWAAAPPASLRGKKGTDTSKQDADSLKESLSAAGHSTLPSEGEKAGAEADGKASHTLRYLLGEERIDVPLGRRKWNRSITVCGARENNLKGIDVTFPLNVMTVVTGVSGSGKSTLVAKTLANALKRRFDEVADTPGEHKELRGDLDAVKALEFVDQHPIGKSSRSNPATYLKAYDEIRRLMAAQPLARQLDYTPAHFSFNTPGGRCEACKGEGTVRVEMQFMADLVLTCDECHGQRFSKEALEIRYHGKNIAEILDLTVTEAIDFFADEASIVRRLRPLADVGLGYIKLGQSSSTLSGGENQRVKLAYYLAQEHADPTLFIFDEPTTGLHFHDIRRLLRSFDALLDKGHTIVIIEHNLDVIKMADHIIELGPEGGDAGGHVVATGTPEQVAAQGEGYTAPFLKAKLEEATATV